MTKLTTFNLLACKPATALLILFATFFAVSCKKKDSAEEVRLTENLLKSQEKYRNLINARPDNEGSFEISNISREADILNIDVKGGCRAADFEVVWDGHILLSYPAQVNLVVHNQSASNCGKDSSFRVQVDLRKIIEDPNPKDFVFHVANGSVKRDKSLHPNGSVTSR